MSIAAEELKLYRDISGRLSSTEVLDGYKNGLFSDITQDERTTGITVQLKVFFKVASLANDQGINAKTFIADITPSDGRAVLYTATQRDATPTGRKYGAGRLNADVIATATSIVVDAETGNGANLIFQVGDTLYIDNGTANEFAVISTVSWSTDQATIGLSSGLSNAYLAATPTTISSCIESAVIECTTDNWVETSSAGTYDEATYPIENDNLGCIEQTWTLTFTSSTAFSVVGDTVGSLLAGSVSADYSPSNSDFSSPYFTLLSAGFGGTWAINDTIVFQTHPATQPFFAELIIDAATAAYSHDDIKLAITLESA